MGAADGSRRVYRGGSFFSNAAQCRSAMRGGAMPSYRSFQLGFRIACAAADSAK
jgi:formylglycine-generating enzyme required for sulfatase activity